MEIFDIFGVILVFALVAYGFGAGAMHLILRVFSWYGAMLLSIAVYPIVKGFLTSFISPDFFLIGYITLLVTGGIFSAAVYFITQPMLQGGMSVPGMVEKALGAGLGLVISVMLLGTFQFITIQINNEITPKWIRDAKIQPVVKKSSDIQSDMLEDNVNKMLFDLSIKKASFR